jgi:hypothetical protein
MRVWFYCTVLGAGLATAAHSTQVKWQPLNSTQPAASEPIPTPVVPSPVASATRTVATSALLPGKIIMYRGSSIVGAGLGCPIRFKGQEIVELARGKYAEWTVPPGRYILNNHTSSLEISVDPGETRYVRCMIKAGFLTGRADLQIVDEEDFNEHRNEYEQKQVANVLVPMK